MRLFLGAGGHSTPTRKQVFISELKKFLSTGIKTMLFIPYAKQDYDRYEREMIEIVLMLGCKLESIHHFSDAHEAVRGAETICVGGGNTFVLLNELYRKNLVEIIRKRVVEEGVPYIGTSAGSNIACPTIATTNDMPIACPPSFNALDFVPFQINPHYTDSVPGKGYRGENRAKRIEEFHELHDEPVVGMREGSILRIEGSSIRLLGTASVKVFTKGQKPQKCPLGANLSWLLKR